MELWQWLRPRQRETSAEVMRALAEPDDVRKVGYLADVAGVADRSLRAAVEAALIRLLPRLMADDAPLLSAEQRLALNRALIGGNAPLALAILKAWEQVGDEAALPYVAKLANTEPDNEMQRRVRDAAAECLPFVRARAEQARETQTLLRASATPQDPPELLLRASTAPSVPADALRPPPDDAGGVAVR